jgi:hypothetical protein
MYSNLLRIRNNFFEKEYISFRKIWTYMYKYVDMHIYTYFYVYVYMFTFINM